jgi:REP element-mobilizing transposase RayT
MVHAYHVILSAYGFWLPNDPRGSWSDFVGAWELLKFGPATKTDTRRSVAHNPHERSLRVAAKRALKNRAVLFNGVQARAIGRGFARYTESTGPAIYACAIMPDHVHLVVSRHTYEVEQVIDLLKSNASRALNEENIKPPTPWARGSWKAFLDIEDMERAIRYVEQNPIRQGLRPQKWSFVKPYPFELL